MKKTIATLAATAVAVASVAFIGCSGEPEADPNANSDAGEDSGDGTGVDGSDMTPEEKAAMEKMKKSGQFTPEGGKAPEKDPTK